MALAAAALGACAAALATQGPRGEARAQGFPLEVEEIRELVARCIRFSDKVPTRPDLTIAVVDTEGNSLGVFHESDVPADADFLDPNGRARRAARALAKAGTASYFSSDEESFTTRTAEFIIEDHFPPGVRFMPAGPLYGVEFSSFGTTDVNPITLPVPAAGFETRVRGELGGIGLFKDGRRVGGLGIDDGVAGHQVSIPDDVLFGGGCAGEYRLQFSNLERGRDLERIALAAARPFLPPADIRAGRIAVGGIRLPFAKGAGLDDVSAPPLDVGVDGDFDPAFPLTAAATIASRFADFTLEPPPGAPRGSPSFRGQVPDKFGIRAGTRLSENDVRRMLWQGALKASQTRGAIRRPIGLKMQCWITVVDVDGSVLGVFRFVEDATLFSYDVAVQKARTAMFFSDDRVAWSDRGLGLFAQQFYPAGQQDRFIGPLFQLQDGITVGLLTGGIPATDFPLRNGITVFPGGVPVYKAGTLAGGVGVSGDGIDQDDLVATFAAEGFGAPARIRCDAVGPDELKRSLRRALDRLEALVPPDPGTCTLSFTDDDEMQPSKGKTGRALVPTNVADVGLSFFHARLRRCRNRLNSVPFISGPSYVKFPRHPGPVTIR